MTRQFVLVGEATSVLEVNRVPKILYTRNYDFASELVVVQLHYPWLQLAGGWSSLEHFTYPYGVQAPALTAVELSVGGELGTHIFAAEVAR